METKKMIQGLHHVTATVGGAQEDYNFYTGLLGLRLVKQTVNFDDHDVYHFYYGNEAGEPGTIMTTFPYGRKGVRPGVNGTGLVTVTAFSVPLASMGYWQNRLEAAGVRASAYRQFSLPVLRFSDPSGLIIELVGNDEDPRAPWGGSEVPAENAIRGFFTIVLSVADVQPTYLFLEEVFGATMQGEEGEVRRYRLGAGGPGQYVDVLNGAGQPRGFNGIGTIHHVAFRIADQEQQRIMRDHLSDIGFYITPVLDRSYFTSVYFRIPGGILFEIATIPPGFQIDEALDELGTGLKLPPWEEPNRNGIQASLDTIAFS